MRPADFQVLRTKFGNFSESVFFFEGGRRQGGGERVMGEGEEGRGVGGEDWV